MEVPLPPLGGGSANPRSSCEGFHKPSKGLGKGVIGVLQAPGPPYARGVSISWKGVLGNRKLFGVMPIMVGETVGDWSGEYL